MHIALFMFINIFIIYFLCVFSWLDCVLEGRCLFISAFFTKPSLVRIFTVQNIWLWNIILTFKTTGMQFFHSFGPHWTASRARLSNMVTTSKRRLFKWIKMIWNEKFTSSGTPAIFHTHYSHMWLMAIGLHGYGTFPPSQRVLLDSTALARLQ